MFINAQFIILQLIYFFNFVYKPRSGIWFGNVWTFYTYIIYVFKSKVNLNISTIFIFSFVSEQMT